MVELSSALPARTVLQRLSERVADPSLGSAVGSVRVAARPLCGQVANAAFRVTVRPEGRQPYVVVARGAVTAAPTGCMLRASLHVAWLVYPLVVMGAAFLIAGISGFVTGARTGETTQWRDWLEPLGMFLVGLLVLVALGSRHAEERGVIVRTLRDAAAVAQGFFAKESSSSPTYSRSPNGRASFSDLVPSDLP